MTLLGKNCDTPTSSLLEATGYECESTISKKKKHLEKQGYLKGPYYHINTNAVGKNELFDVYADISFDVSDYNLVFDLIQAIRCWRSIFPVIQGDRFFVYFQCNYYTQIAQLLSLLKKEGIISYSFYSCQSRPIVENPHFFGKEILSCDNIFSECELPDITYLPKKIDQVWRQLDVRIMGYLQVRSFNIHNFRKFEHDFYGYDWKREQIKYSIHKLIEHGVAVEKNYHISPYPRNQCFSSLLTVKTANPSLTLRVMSNLGRGCRIYKTYVLAGELGIVFMWASERNIPNFLSEIEDMDGLLVKTYQLKAHNTRYVMKQSFDVENFDLENQRWVFPYQVYEENIERLLEKRR